MEDQEDETGNCSFEISTEPATDNGSIIIPMYDSSTVGYKLTETSVSLQVSYKKKPNVGNPCWNCGETGHIIRDCKKPRDRQAFQRNRQMFMERQACKPIKKVFHRYHVDKEQKFGRFQPGKVSKRLRKALGIRKDELPQHIYRMRLLGYPPGWLEEAKIVHSGINIFDGKGNAIGEVDDEEGELVDFEQRSKYDINRLVEYPGFNVMPSPNTHDEWEQFDSAPMLERQSLEEMVAVLMPNAAQAYKRRKLSNLLASSPPPPPPAPDFDESAKDMECEETPEIHLLPEDNCHFIPPLPEEDQSVPPPPPADDNAVPPQALEGENSLSEGEISLPAKSEENTNLSTASQNCDSASLGDLEEQKKSLLNQLDDNASSDSAPTTPIIKRLKVSNRDSQSPILGQMKSVDLGTPILKSHTPYTKLPSSECFSQNICDVINFENLPDYTGVYDRMIDVISKVRTVVKRIQQED